jgi:hypothetical protein
MPRGVKNMSGENELGFSFEEVRSGQWRTSIWTETAKHRFYGISINYDAKMVYCGSGLNLEREWINARCIKERGTEKEGTTEGGGSRLDRLLLIDVGEDHLHVEFSTKNLMLVAKAMSIIEMAVEDKDKALNYIMNIIKKANETSILIDMNCEALMSV